MLYDNVVGAFEIATLDSDLGPYLFLQEQAARTHRHIVQHELKRSVPRSALPERARVIHVIESGGRFDLIAEVDEVLVMLRVWRASAEVWAAATDAGTANTVIKEIRARLPKLIDDHRVEVCFTDANTGNRYLKLDVRPWSEIRHLYGEDVQRALDRIMLHQPSEDEARRLLLWHGPAGTGKTSAIRALLHAWRAWATALIVTDPESLLSGGRYLRRTVLSEQEDEGWQLVVLEDAEALLRKGSGGSGVGRLLNLADGLLGQGLRCMFLLTTNEPLGVIHPAVVRPGRCLANLEFGPLSATQAAAILGRPISHAMTLAEVMTAAPLSVPIEEAAVGQYL